MEQIIEEIKKEASNYKGMEFTARTFKFCFNYGFREGMDVLNELVKRNIFEISGRTLNLKSLVYRVK